MPTLSELASLSDDQLFAKVRAIVARTNVALAELLAHLAEVEERGMHRQRACASLYTYCIYELRMSEDEAYRRSKAARLVRQYPELFERIARGELHLTGLLMLGPHLDCERRNEILDLAQFRSKREIQELVARLDPKPDVPARVEPIGPAPAGSATHTRFAQALAPAVRSLPVGASPADWIEADEGREVLESADLHSAPAAAHDVVPETAAKREPLDLRTELSPVRFKVQFTATQRHVDAMNEALDLLSHELPARDIAEVHARAMELLVAELRKQKRADTNASRSDAKPSHPVPGRNNERTRHIPAEVRRQVWARDDARCCYVDENGRRCEETSRLELHHREAYAKGGAHTVANIELRCRAHNDLAAEADFGREYMASVRGTLSGGDTRWRGDSPNRAGSHPHSHEPTRSPARAPPQAPTLAR